MNNIESERHRLDFLDSLRGFAAFYVVFYHMVLLADPILQIPKYLELYISAGGTGVTLFFVLSSFALCHSSDRRTAHPDKLIYFYIKRFLESRLFFI